MVRLDLQSLSLPQRASDGAQYFNPLIMPWSFWAPATIISLAYKRYSCNCRDSKGFRTCVPGTQDKGRLSISPGYLLDPSESKESSHSIPSLLWVCSKSSTKFNELFFQYHLDFFPLTYYLLATLGCQPDIPALFVKKMPILFQ